MKPKKQEQIVYIDPESCTVQPLTGGILTDEKDHHFSKANLYISHINSSAMGKTTVELDKELPEEDTNELITEKVYEELKIDPETPYEIRYHKKGLNFDGSKMEYDVLTLEHEALLSQFSKCTEKIPYIDYILPSPFLFSVLYEIGALPREGSHAFVYLAKSDSFFLLFEDGKLLYYKTLPLTLSKLFEAYNNFSAQSVSREDFKQILSGMKDDFEYSSELRKLYDEVSIALEEILIYIKRIYTISTFEKIFIDSDTKLNDSFYAYLSDYLMLSCQSYSFDYGLPEADDVSHLGKLAMINAREFKKGREDEFNFTIFPKPAPFHKRDAGIMIMTTAASFVAAFAYPLYLYINVLALDAENRELARERNVVQGKAAQLQIEIAELQQERKDTLERLGFSQKETERQFRILYDIYQRQNRYTPKTDMIIELVGEVSDNGVRIDTFRIEKTGEVSRVEMDVNSGQHEKLTKLIQALENNKKYTVSVNDIVNEGNTSTYVTKIGLALQ